MAMEGDLKRVTALSKSEAINPDQVKNVDSQYQNIFDEQKGGTVETRAHRYLKTFFN